MSESIDSVLAYWFGDEADDAQTAQRQAALWWSKSPEVDADIGRRFGQSVLDAEAGRLSHWLSSARGYLALIVLTDQFPRNIHRGQPLAFHCDPVARWFCLEGLNHSIDRQLRPIHRLFFYLPLEHAEDIGLQNRSVQLFDSLATEVTADARDQFEKFAAYAHQHKAIIERFGRFPHRNEILQRESSEAELAFLQQPGSSF